MPQFLPLSKNHSTLAPLRMTHRKVAKTISSEGQTDPHERWSGTHSNGEITCHGTHPAGESVLQRENMEQKGRTAQRASSQQPQEREAESELQVTEKARSNPQTRTTAAAQGPPYSNRKVQDVQCSGTRVKSVSPRGTDAGTTRPRGQVRVSPAGDSEERKEQRGSPRGRGSKRSEMGKGKERRALSLSLAPPSAHLEPLMRREQEEPDSASDLSDSERLPLLPPPRTPPQLELRAEVIGPDPLQPPLPGPWVPFLGSQSYPDFLPTPFNTWSLRQLAVFVHTEGRSAPRPRPATLLERYLERLLQLEWLQVQTIQEENGRPTASVSVSRPRPHTAPPSSLSSPKCLRHCQRAFPLAFLSSLADPAAGALSGRVCPHCRVRYPFCNGACRLYGYQRYSRLGPLPERRARGGALPSRSSSESRAGLAHQCREPGSSAGGSSHLQRMQAAGNIRRPTGGQRPMSRPLSSPPCFVSGASRSEGPSREAGSSCENVRDGRPLITARSDGEQVVPVGRDSKTHPVGSLKDLSCVSGARVNSNLKVKFVAQ
ncbi:uncharacterized protein fam217bb isoform X3 [Scleropages formosus]|uniref:uncharacterized protein fam217bb isoform X3 n=1 Tax=Scleropages formosus TaxID=113540 RepID=UPI0010FA93F7|nr:uncharacterized protein LOC108923342 isoform X3 [Scleropages formosus]